MNISRADCLWLSKTRLNKSSICVTWSCFFLFHSAIIGRNVDLFKKNLLQFVYAMPAVSTLIMTVPGSAWFLFLRVISSSCLQFMSGMLFFLPYYWLSFADISGEQCVKGELTKSYLSWSIEFRKRGSVLSLFLMSHVVCSMVWMSWNWDFAHGSPHISTTNISGLKMLACPGVWIVPKQNQFGLRNLVL